MLRRALRFFAGDVFSGGNGVVNSLQNMRLSFLQQPLMHRLNRASRTLLMPDDGPAIDFASPPGESAFSSPDSVSWRIFKNPLSLYVGGVAAVILELAEPRVRTGVWEYSGFRANPVRRLRRTGLAAMVTVYGAQSTARGMISRISSLHGRVEGKTPSGEPYRADDPELLNWVHATAAFGFLQAYHVYVAPISSADRDRYYREGRRTARLYGVTNSPTSEEELHCILAGMRERLEPSKILSEFLRIMRESPILPVLLRPVQPLLVGAAVALLPPWIHEILHLRESAHLRGWQSLLLKRAASAADTLMIESSPPVQACLRMGLPANYLYRKAR